MNRLNRRLASALLLISALFALNSAQALAAPSYEVDLEREAPIVNRGDERVNYTVKVKNLAATTGVAAVGEEMFCVGEHPLKTWSPINAVENTIQWLRNGAPIVGATGNVYTATVADEGAALQCLVKGENEAAASVQVSQPPSVVAPPPTPLPPATVLPTNAASRPTIVGTGAATVARTCAPPTNWTGAAFGTANTTSGSKALSAVSSHPWAVGQQISGPGIPNGATITSVAPGALQISVNANATAAGVAISAQSAGAGSLISGSNVVTGLRTAVGTGSLASGSTAVTALSTTLGRWAIGLPVSGAGIPAGTTVTAATATSLTLSQAATETATGVELVSDGPLPFAVGQEVEAAGIPAGTTVTAVSAGSLELSAPATATATDATIAGTTGGRWSFQWLRNGAPVPGGTSYAYRPAANDTGTILQCQVIGANSGGATLGTSNNGPVGTVVNPPNNLVNNTPATLADPTKLTLDLPGGLETFAYEVNATGGWLCTPTGASPGQNARVTCFFLQPAAIGSFYPTVAVGAGLGPDAPALAVAEAQVSGSGATEVSSDKDEFTFNPLLEFGISELAIKVGGDAIGSTDYTKAGGHPVTAAAFFKLNLKTRLSQVGGLESRKYVPIEQLRTVVVDTPRGFVGNAVAPPVLCPSGEDVIKETCPAGSAVGAVNLVLPNVGDFDDPFTPLIFALKPERGKPALFGFKEDLGNLFTFYPELRPDDGYAISIVAAPSPEVNVLQVEPILCGFGLKSIVPEVTCYEPNEPGANPTPLVTNPTQCREAPPTTVSVDSWTQPGKMKSYKTTTPILQECENVPFDPELALQPTVQQAESASGLEVNLTMPTDGLLDPTGVAQAHLKKTTVTLPKGMSLNPSAANGLDACTQAQLGMVNGVPNDEPVQCPDASKIGTAMVKTPILAETLEGGVYLAKQGDHPFKGDLAAIYVVAESKERGLLIKLKGRVEIRPGGQIVSTFDDNPEAPFSSLELKFNSGPRAALLTPQKCGTYEIASTLTPWSAADPDNPTPAETVTQSSSFQVTSGPGGAGCPSGALLPKLTAGVSDPIAATSSPFVVRLSRDDGTQRFNGLSMTLPMGLTASLRGVSYCPDAVLASVPAAEGTGAAELASPSCPAASKIGSVSVGAGAGNPFYVNTGKAYLAGPYKGAPLSLAVVIPAVAGPFDLGNVVVRNALYVDPSTARISVKSDPLPTELHNLPIDVRDIRVRIDREGFTRTPTSCESMSIDAVVSGDEGGLSPAADRFQVGNCSALGFKPQLNLKLSGGTRRDAHPKLRAELKQPAGQANIGGVSVVLPRTQFIDQDRIGNVCTRPQFAAEACPKSSILGNAVAYTPLLDEPLRGKVYFRANGGERELPDMVVDLKGQVPVVLVGYVDSVVKKGTEISRIRNRFAVVPDAPVSKFVLNLKGGKEGLLVNSTDICAKKFKATVKMKAHNGKARDFSPVIKNDCGKKKNKKAKKSNKSPRANAPWYTRNFAD